MRLLFITCLLIISALTGCSLFGEAQTNTKPISATDLAEKHVYKIPETTKETHHLQRLNNPQLTRLITVALNDAPNMRSAKARIERAEQLAKMANSTLWPSVDLSGNLASASFPIHGTLPPQFAGLNFDKANTGGIGLKFNYELDFWGKNRETLASRLSEAFAAQMDLAETRLLLSTAIATAYFDIQNNHIQQGLAKDNARLLKQLADITIDREKQGIESNIPVKTAVANAQAALLSVEEYKQTELQSRHKLAVLMGKNPFNTDIETPEFTYNKKQLTLPKIIPANVLAQRPDIAAARALAEAAAHQVNVAKNRFFPQY